MSSSETSREKESLELVYRMLHEQGRVWLATRRLPPDQIEDAIQYAFFSVSDLLRRKPELQDDKDRLRAIAWASLRNATFARLRKSRSTYDLSLAEDIVDPSSPLPQDIAVQHELMEAIHEAIARLPETDRTIIEARLRGASSREVAETLGVSAQHVHMRMYRAMKRLRAALQEEGIIPP